MIESDKLRLELRKAYNPVVTNSSYSISKHFAKRVTSKNNQSVSMMTVGGLGQGKSSSNIILAINIAIEVAKIKGGHWTKYFNADHIGILTKDEIYRVIQLDQRYGIIIADDVGAAYNARKWQSEGNIMLNDIAQVSRTENQAMLMTLPDSILIDKVPRALCNYFMTMDTPQYDRGVSIGKFFKIVRQPRQDKTYFTYETLNGLKFQKALFARPPSFIMDDYEKRRYDVAHKLKQDALTEHLKKEAEKATPKEPKVSKKQRILEIDRDLQAGIYGSLKEGLVKNGLGSDVYYARTIISSAKV